MRWNVVFHIANYKVVDEFRSEREALESLFATVKWHRTTGWHVTENSEWKYTFKKRSNERIIEVQRA